MSERYICSTCGQETDWEEELGDRPLCVECWDSRSDRDNKVAARNRRYYEQNREKVAARQRRWREQNREKVAASSKN
jgi:DNA-directed RNA polymerase subunit RPC12/RpoP